MGTELDLWDVCATSELAQEEYLDLHNKLRAAEIKLKNSESKLAECESERDALREELRKAREQEPVAEIADVWELRYCGSEPIAGIVDRHKLKIGSKLYASPVPAQNWMPIESAPDNEWVLVTGNNMIGDPPEGRFYMRAKKEDDEFISTDGFGEIYNPGYLTHWTHEPKSDENKIVERLPY